jgi:hypothetical protein
MHNIPDLMTFAPLLAVLGLGVFAVLLWMLGL